MCGSPCGLPGMGWDSLTPVRRQMVRNSMWQTLQQGKKALLHLHYYSFVPSKA